MHSYDIDVAAKLAEASYTATTHPSVKPHLKMSLNEKDVEAHYLTNGVLLIPGSNSLMDYARFNLRVLNLGGKRYKMSDEGTKKGASGTTWHQGFLAHAKAIYDWIEHHNEKPKFIIGHSLGAAATQILSKSWRVPGIGFAAPRPRRFSGRLRNDELCLCINRSDDSVCDLPPNFHHMGKVISCSHLSQLFSMKHAMKHYRKAVEEQQAAGVLGKSWPS
jgi:hypothetical protein